MTGVSDYIILNSSRLKVEVAKPGKVYTRTRFDWTVFISQVTLDGKNTFCSKESYIPGDGTGGAGFCNEFGIETALGYEEAAVGEWFSKIGVGLLKKFSNDCYKFWVDYEQRPYPVHISVDESCLKFELEPMDCNGYSVSLIKRLSVQDNRLKIEYSLENTGIKPIETNEYCHNFLRINDFKLGEEYRLNFPYGIKPDRKSETVTFQNSSIIWENTPDREYYHIIEGFQPDMPFQWELIHKPTGIGVRELSRLQTTKIAMWGRSYVVSPEVFVSIRLEPGQTTQWCREYEFFD